MIDHSYSLMRSLLYITLGSIIEEEDESQEELHNQENASDSSILLANFEDSVDKAIIAFKGMLHIN